jgi:hypothetical protein
MAQHDYSIANQSGLAFRQDLNNALAAIVSVNSGASEPSTTYAYQLWADTTAGQLKQRNAANSAWVVIGTLGSTGWGLAPLASPTFTGTATFTGDVNLTGTGAIDVPAGTTAQRPGSPSAGMVRYNTTLSQFEGYSGSAWGTIGGGAKGGGTDQIFYENGQTVSTDYTVASTVNAMSAGPITIGSGVTVTVSSGATWTVV